MIAIGGSIGTGLFVGSGKAIAEGGPLGVVIGWAIAGSQIIGTIHGLGEITVRFPVVGAFANYGTKIFGSKYKFCCFDHIRATVVFCITLRNHCGGNDRTVLELVY